VRPLLTALLLAPSVALLACAPSVPTGGFRCSTSDQACPGGQHCTCGLCVAHDREAACGFDVQVDTGTVREHQPFSVSITARAKDGTPAAGFNGTVALGFRLPDGTKWADVRPPSVQLTGGAAQARVTLNRETIPPQAPRLTAEFADQQGASGGIHVLAPAFVKEPQPVAAGPFGWASSVGSAAVVHDGTQFRMYFTGSKGMNPPQVGLALSSDGKTFTPKPDVVFPAPGSLFPKNAVIVSAHPFVVGNAWSLAFYSQDMASGGSLDIGLAASPDGLGTFDLANGGNPILTRASCGSYCSQNAWFPSLTPITSGGAPAWLMFFSAVRCDAPSGSCSGFMNVSMSIGRAGSTDGVHFQPEPAPVLSGDTGGEAYLATPQVFVDGSVYKMYYGFTHSLGATASPCDPGAKIQIGYATSTDGFYWVRSPSNPVVTVGGTTWDKSAPGMVVSSVVPADGKDPESGLFLYYDPFAAVPFPPYCVPVSIGRAVTQ